MHWLVTAKGLEENCDLARLHQALRTKRGPLWLDIEAPKKADFDLLSSGFGIHALTIEDIHQGGQRPKWEDYPGYTFLVLMAMEWTKQGVALEEQYLCISPTWVVSIHQQANPALGEVRRRLGLDPSLTQGKSMFLTYMVTEAIVDSAFPALDAIDDEVDQLEDRLVTTAWAPSGTPSSGWSASPSTPISPMRRCTSGTSTITWFASTRRWTPCVICSRGPWIPTSRPCPTVSTAP
jgi:Mg2+ and Co2+ transporter CorA